MTFDPHCWKFKTEGIPLKWLQSLNSMSVSDKQKKKKNILE
jgi:hypothetical protein